MDDVKEQVITVRLDDETLVRLGDVIRASVESGVASALTSGSVAIESFSASAYLELVEMMKRAYNELGEDD